jgi:hypothetical protein
MVVDISDLVHKRVRVPESNLEVAAAKVRARLEAIAEERAKAGADPSAEGPRLEAGAAIVRAALDLLDDPQELYQQTSNAVRRQLNQVFFGKLYLDADEVTDDLLAERFDGLLYRRSFRRRTSLHRRSKPGHAKTGDLIGADPRTGTATALFERIARDEGSNKDTMVDLKGRLNPSTRDKVADIARLVDGAVQGKPGNPGQPRLTDGALCAMRRAPQRRLTADEQSGLIAGYRDGQSVKELAARYHVHRTTVTAALLRCGEPLRPVGLSDDQVDEAARRYLNGWSLAMLGAAFTVDDETVRQALQRAGISGSS